MPSVANSIGIRSHGIAGATLATLDLARARIFSLVRVGFPPFVEGADKFAFCAGANVVTVRLASGDEGSTLARPSIEGIALWYQSDEVQRIASALTAAGSSTRRIRLAAGDTGTITAKMHHFAIARVATELSIRAERFFAMTYANPADDPRKKH
jgi:hypothetical protein